MALETDQEALTPEKLNALWAYAELRGNLNSFCNSSLIDVYDCQQRVELIDGFIWKETFFIT